MAERSTRVAAAVTTSRPQSLLASKRFILFMLLAVACVPLADWLLVSMLAGSPGLPGLMLLKGAGVTVAFVAVVRAVERGGRVAGDAPRDGSPAFIQKTMEAMREIVFVTHPDGRLRYVCPNVERATGIPIENFHAAGNVSAIVDEDPGRAVAAGAVDQIGNVPARLTVAGSQSHELLLNVHRSDIDGDALLYVGRTFSDFDLAESVMHRIFWHSQDPIIFVSSPDRRIVNCNPATTAVFGYEREELVGKTTERLHCDRDTFDGYGEQSLLDIDKRGHAQIEYRMRHRDGRLLDVDIRTVRVGSRGDKSGGHISIIHDVTARREAENIVAIVDGAVRGIANCRAVEDAYPPILETLCRHSGWAVGETWVPADHGFVRIAKTASDPMALDYLISTDDMTPSLSDPLLGAVRTSRAPLFIHDLAEPASGSSGIARHAVAHGLHAACAIPLLAGGEVRAILTFLTPGAGRRKPHWLDAVATAISPFSALVARVESEERLRAKEREARHSRERLRQLARRLEQLRETERKQLARELHDQMGSDLTALKIQLGLAAGTVEDREPSRQAINTAAGVADRIVENVRSMAMRLRPAVLDDHGIAAGVEWLVEQARQFAAGRIELAVDDGIPALDDDAATALFRVCQESLTNVLRHAGASETQVRFVAGPGYVALSVTDNGRGMPDVPATAGGRLGIVGMQERMSSVNGTLTIEQPATGGTRVLARLPVDTASEPEGPGT